MIPRLLKTTLVLKPLEYWTLYIYLSLLMHSVLRLNFLRKITRTWSPSLNLLVSFSKHVPSYLEILLLSLTCSLILSHLYVSLCFFFLLLLLFSNFIILYRDFWMNWITCNIYMIWMQSWHSLTNFLRLISPSILLLLLLIETRFHFLVNM